MKSGILTFLLAVCVATPPVASYAGTVEVVDSSAEAAFWLGGEEAVDALAEAVFALGPATPPGPVDPEPATPDDAWIVGEDAKAFVQDGVLYVRGAGAVTSTPWSSVAATVEKVKIAEDITEIPEGALAGMKNLEQVNGLKLSVFNGVAAGAVKSGGFTAIAIDPSTKTGTVTFRVKTAPTVGTPADEWTAVEPDDVTVEGTGINVPVPAADPAGFFRVLVD